MRILLGLLGFLTFVYSVHETFAAEGSYVSQQGAWIRNKAESKIPPDSFTPLDQPMVVMQDDGKQLKFVVFAMTSTGLQPDITYDGAYDGQPYTYGKDGTKSYTHLSANSFRTDWKSVNGSTASEVVTINANATKMRIEGKRTDPDGKTYEYVQVWDRME